jgi:protein disulfide-isomerase A4
MRLAWNVRDATAAACVLSVHVLQSCTHSRALLWELAPSLSLQQPSCNQTRVQIDATVETELGTKFGVSGYPTLKWFVDGEPQEYKGPREA